VSLCEKLIGCVEFFETFQFSTSRFDLVDHTVTFLLKTKLYKLNENFGESSNFFVVRMR